MHDDNFVPVSRDVQAAEEILAHGFTRRPLKIDQDAARSLGELAHAAWSMPKDQYYGGGDRFRTLNRFKAQIVENGVRVWAHDDTQPYVQLEKYNTTLGGTPRVYSPLPAEIAGSAGIRKIMSHHLMYLPLSKIGATYFVNMHVMRFAAAPSRPCDTRPSGLHKDGEKYLATHLLARCGAKGGEVVITDNDKRELDRFTLREAGECYVFDDDRVWHMLTPIEILDGNRFAFRDTVTFDLLPDDWQPAR
jgi:hypothetical protein